MTNGNSNFIFKNSIAKNARMYNDNINKTNKTKKCRGTKKHNCSTLIETKFQLCTICRRENDSIGRKKHFEKFIEKHPEYHKKYGKGYVQRTKEECHIKKPEIKAPGGITKMKELGITPCVVREWLAEQIINKEEK